MGILEWPVVVSGLRGELHSALKIALRLGRAMTAALPKRGSFVRRLFPPLCPLDPPRTARVTRRPFPAVGTIVLRAVGQAAGGTHVVMKLLTFSLPESVSLPPRGGLEY